MAKPHTSAGWPNGVNYTTTSFLVIFAACTSTIDAKMSKMNTVDAVHATAVFAVYNSVLDPNWHMMQYIASYC